ncbi:MAG: hypothetical protein V4485_06045 [Pseudomonadota bacterium]
MSNYHFGVLEEAYYIPWQNIGRKIEGKIAKNLRKFAQIKNLVHLVYYKLRDANDVFIKV